MSAVPLVKGKADLPPAGKASTLAKQQLTSPDEVTRMQTVLSALNIDKERVS
jgi:hypothetical protein